MLTRDDSSVLVPSGHPVATTAPGNPVHPVPKPDNETAKPPLFDWPMMHTREAIVKAERARQGARGQGFDRAQGAL